MGKDRYEGRRGKARYKNQGAIIINYNQQIMSRQSWSIEQDEAIIKLVEECGVEDWTKIASRLKDHLGTERRTGKQCRERWYNHLSPTVNKQPWTQQEEELLFIHHKNYGNRWKDISKHFIGRTDNDIKNHFYSTLRRSLRRLNKIVGEKNSTTQMREIKPSVLSTIMNYIYGQEHPETELVQSLKDLPILIFEFAKFKPIKLNIKNANLHTIREKTNEIFNLISRFNHQYEKNKQLRRYLKTEKKYRRHAHSDDGFEVKVEKSQDQQVYIKQEQISPQEQKVQTVAQQQHHHDQKYNEKTEFSLHHEHYHELHHYELTPIALLHHQIPSPKPVSKDPLLPSAHRRFSLQADDVNEMQFNQPEEPSQLNIEEEMQLNEPNQSSPQASGDNEHSQLIDEIIETHFRN